MRNFVYYGSIICAIISLIVAQTMSSSDSVVYNYLMFAALAFALVSVLTAVLPAFWRWKDKKLDAEEDREWHRKNRVIMKKDHK